MDYCINIQISMHLTSIVTISLLLLTTLPPSLSQQPLFNYSLCSNQPYKCGRLTDLYYPFWGQNRPRYCGGGEQFHLTCDSDRTPIIQMPSQKFAVTDIDTKAHTMTLIPLEYNVCSPQFNFSLSPLLWYANTVTNITVFYDCPSEVSERTANNFTCQVNGSENHHNGVYHMGLEDQVMELYPELKRCKRRMQVPEDENAQPPDGGLQALYGALRVGFQVNYIVSEECTRCLGSEGACGSNTCYCPDGSNALDCSAPAPDPVPVPHHKSNRLLKRKVITGVIVTVVVAGLMLICIICCFRCKSSRLQEIFWLRTSSNKDIEAFLKNHGALTLKRYKFSDVKKMTNCFKFKLGEGGFGVVYKGKLLNGYPVAVKILNSSKGNNDDFINEVVSIGRTSHVNVVTLLGFCLEGHRKALIYEFMSNGSLEKFISKKGSQTTPSLSWDNLIQIAIGIARGLEYLHRGCSTRILHFDIKPHNILLDENFCPKISDFGLSKLCIKKESIVSMSDARGTIGYIAPEVWNRHFGGVSHKSDVYSYGMMLLEIVGETKNINAEASHTSEIYFPDWVYRRLEQGTHLGLDGELAIAENEVIKRMTIVGLWCIQTIPNDRPTMSRVVDMLEDSTNSLEMPPKPFLSSPVRSMAESSNTIVD